MSELLVTGGLGYLGSVLVPRLIERGHRVKVLDIGWFGDHLSGRLSGDKNYELIKGDIRDVDLVGHAVSECDTVIHLACISNDPCSDLDVELTFSINLHAYKGLLEAASRGGVKKFINASSSSVYGVKEDRHVTEDLPLEPITVYATCKAESEELVRSFESKHFKTISVRSATLCGYSPRQRLDLTVNILTNYAINKGQIVVHGGRQQRPNIHVNDIADFYLGLVEMNPEAWGGLSYNVGYQNHSILEIARIVRQVVGKESVKIEITDTDDLRSYRIDSSLVFERLGFKPKHTLEEAVEDLKKAFASQLLCDSFENPQYYNIKTMKSLGTGCPESLNI